MLREVYWIPEFESSQSVLALLLFNDLSKTDLAFRWKIVGNGGRALSSRSLQILKSQRKCSVALSFSPKHNLIRCGRKYNEDWPDFAGVDRQESRVGHKCEVPKIAKLKVT